MNAGIWATVWPFLLAAGIVIVLLALAYQRGRRKF